ncbi:MAG: ribosome biogenesis GTPase Der [Nitrospirae bacterium]|nr:ribosome biogenesis GTPase Der [Nitrospirota bacterium]
MRPSPAKLPVVAIVGRPNVGKSTLFNRLIGRRVAIVMDTPGVTRDRHYLELRWGRLHFTLVDTGGVDVVDADHMGRLVGDQALRILDEAAAVLFLTDARDGVTPADQEMAALLRRYRGPVIHLVNKADTEHLDHVAMEACALGLDTVIPISAEHSRGLDDLYDHLLAALGPSETAIEPEAGEEAEVEAEVEATIRVAVLGRPNVGKSTLINRLLGEDRLIVSDVPGTTRDAIDSLLTYQGRPYLFIDTAGIRRRGKIGRGVERASVGRTMQGLDRAEVAVLLLDATEGITEQDTKISGQIIQARRGCIIAFNKWDLHKGDDDTRARIKRELDRLFPFLTFAPTMFLSGLSGFNLSKLFPRIDAVAAAFRRRIPTAELNRTIEQLVARQEPPLHKNRRVRIYYATQAGVAPPRFVLFTNMPGGIQEPYLRYLENGLRAAYDFVGTPLAISVRHRSKEKRT